MSPGEPPMIVVLGPFRSGTSCVAGVLHRLGVHMGEDWHRIPHQQPETYEEIDLKLLCQAILNDSPRGRALRGTRLVEELAAWARGQRARARALGKPPGAKHPLLCGMIPELKRAFGPLVAVNVERPLDLAIRSLQQQDWWNVTPERYAGLQQRLDAARQAHLAGLEHVNVVYHDLLADPAGGVARLAAALDLDAGPEAHAEAAAWVHPRTPDDDALS